MCYYRLVGLNFPRYLPHLWEIWMNPACCQRFLNRIPFILLFLQLDPWAFKVKLPRSQPPLEVSSLPTDGFTQSNVWCIPKLIWQVVCAIRGVAREAKFILTVLVGETLTRIHLSCGKFRNISAFISVLPVRNSLIANFFTSFASVD